MQLPVLTTDLSVFFFFLSSDGEVTSLTAGWLACRVQEKAMYEGRIEGMRV